MSNVKSYEDIKWAIDFVSTSVSDEKLRAKILLMLNELWALRNSHEVQSVRSILDYTCSSAPERGEDGMLVRRMGIYDPDETEMREVEDAIVLNQLANDAFIIVDETSVGAKFFDGEYAKKPTKKHDKEAE